MRLGRSAPLTDAADLRFRVATVKAGCWLTLAMCGAGLIYDVQTWEAGNRPLIVGLTLGSILSAVALLVVVPTGRIVAGRWRETFFMGWTFSMIAMLLTLGALDPEPASPLVLPLFMPLLFAGMSYPFRTASIAAVAAVGGYLGLSLAERAPLAYSGFILSCLTWTAFMCLWQARLREAQRRDLDDHRDQLALASRADALTGALNRRGFDERLQAELAEAVRAGRPLTLAMFDLDDFKGVNDRDGHGAGDALLVLLVELMTAVLRPLDAVGRLGGDEFAVILPGASGADAAVVLDRVQAALAGRVAVSSGYAAFPADGLTAPELHRSADAALYAAKAARPAGRGTTGVDLSWATAMADAVDRRMGASHGHAVSVAGYAAGSPPGSAGPRRTSGRCGSRRRCTTSARSPSPTGSCRSPGRSTETELEAVRRHPMTGAQIVARVAGMEEIAAWIGHSHEHFDGSGYPRGLAGDAIPHAARILLVADAFDAMTTDRCYRRALTDEAALEELDRNAGGQFDPDCVAPSRRSSPPRRAPDQAGAGRRPAAARPATCCSTMPATTASAPASWTRGRRSRPARASRRRRRSTGSRLTNAPASSAGTRAWA